MPVYVGTSGWQYRHWRETFYPKEVAQKLWLEYYARRFQTVELNNSFYHLPKKESFAAWRARTPADFIVAAKMSRYVTHIRRLRESRDGVALFMEHAAHLGEKLGPILLQLPPNLKLDLESLDDTLSYFPRSVRVAVEFRHESWFIEDVREILQRRNAALCLADRQSKPVTALWRTADWSFVRFHQGRATPHPCYGATALGTWARRLAGMWAPEEDVFVFFNNDPRACAIRDARVFAAAARRVGLRPTRVPGAREVTIG